MKKFTKLLCLLLASLMVLLCFAACGGDKETTTEAPEQTKGPSQDVEETGRDAVKDEVPADLKYTGETVTFLTRDDGSNIFSYDLGCEELMNDTLYDAIHYRNIDVETRLGLTIKTIGQPSLGNNMTTWNNILSTAVLNNSSDYDGATIYASQGSPLAKDGIYYDLNTVSSEYGEGYLDLAKPWWNQTLVSELSTYGALYFLAGDALISNTAQGYCLFFNKELFNEKFPTEGVDVLYSAARDGVWTIEKLIDYVSQTWDDNNSNGVIDDGDVMGWSALGGLLDGGMDAWIYALGLNITEMNIYGEPELSLIYDPNIVPAYELVQKLYTGTEGSYGSTGSDAKLTETSMQNGNVLFSRVFLKSGSSMRDSEVSYGVLPLPKYDEDQENYRTIFCNNSSFLVFCSNLSDERAVMLSAVAELLSSTSYHDVTPVYYSTVLQGQYSKDQPDAEMYEIILGSFVADFGFAYSTKSLSAVGSLFRDVSIGFDIRTKIDANKTVYETSLTALLEALDAVA